MPTNPTVHASGTGLVYWNPGTGIQTIIYPSGGLTRGGIWVPLQALQGSAGYYTQLVSIAGPDGEPASVANPIPVEVVQSTGTEVHDANNSSVGGMTQDVHDYLVPDGKNFELLGILASASGNIKVTLAYTISGPSFTEICTRFNDRAPGADVNLLVAKNVPAGGVVRITRLNRQGQAFNISTTIIGLLKDA